MCVTKCYTRKIVRPSTRRSKAAPCSILPALKSSFTGSVSQYGKQTNKRHFDGAFDIVTERSKKLRHVRAIVENTSHAVLNLSKYAQQIDSIVFSYYTFKCILAITTTTIF